VISHRSSHLSLSLSAFLYYALKEVAVSLIASPGITPIVEQLCWVHSLCEARYLGQKTEANRNTGIMDVSARHAAPLPH